MAPAHSLRLGDLNQVTSGTDTANMYPRDEGRISIWQCRDSSNTRAAACGNIQAPVGHTAQDLTWRLALHMLPV